MAKTKKKNPRQQKSSLSPDMYMRRVMRTLPVEKCYVTSGWQQAGIGHVIVVRRRPDGKFAFVSYLVDTFCLGVKDVMWHTRMEDYELESLLDDYKSQHDLVETDYATVHNLVLGAIEFAEEGGIEPCREWLVGQYGLDEDSDDIPLIEFDYGRDGRHFLCTSTRAEGVKYMPILRAYLGDDFDFLIGVDGDKNEYTDFGSPYNDDYPEEEYLEPEGVEYPAELKLNHPWLEEILSDNANDMGVPVDDMARIAALDREELLADLHTLALYHIGLGNADKPSGLMMHVVTILNSVSDPRGLDTLLSILRTDQDTLDFYFGDAAPNVFASAISRCSAGRFEDLESFLNEPGRTWYNRSMVLDALGIVSKDHREEVTGILRRQLESLPERIEELVSADAEYAGFLCSTCMEVGDRSLLPLIKTLYDEDLIAVGVCGNYQEVEKDYGTRNDSHPMTMSEIYAWLKSFDRPGRAHVEQTDYEHLWS